jgi:hypothetical protein
VVTLRNCITFLQNRRLAGSGLRIQTLTADGDQTKFIEQHEDRR